MRKGIIVLFVFVIGICVLGTVNAQYTVDEVGIKSGDNTQVVINDGTINTVRSTGPVSASLVSDDTVRVTANDVQSSSTGKVYMVTGSGQEVVDIRVISSGRSTSGGGNNSSIVQRYREDAQTLREIEDSWIETRIRRESTGDGQLVVPQQYDPIGGGWDEEAGLPKGEWVDVGVDDEGNPEWMFNNASELLIYMSREAHSSQTYYTRFTTVGILAVIGSLLVQWVVYPRLKKKKEEKEKFRNN